MNATEQGLLHAIATEPDDDLHRLVYADWLDDHGQADRAEFIRAQIQLACDPTDSPHRCALAFRARQLLDQHEAEWTEILEYAASEWTFSRGFIEAIAIEAVDLDLLEAEKLSARLPLRRLAIRGLEDVDQLQKIAEDNRLLGLDLTANLLSGDDVKALARLPALSRLRRLSLSFNRLTDTAIGFLTRSAFFRGMELLRLGANPFTADGRDHLRAVFGSALSFVCEREPDHLYRFTNVRHLLTGVIPGHRQILVDWIRNAMHAALFDFEGNLLDIRERPLLASDIVRRGQEQEDWLREMKFQAGPVRVKRFWLDRRTGILDFPEEWVDDFDRLDPLEGNLAASVQDWLGDGTFEWHKSAVRLWFDRDGKVIE